MFVGGLPLHVVEADLEHYFQQWRAVDRCSVIVNPQTGRSRGFGFVTFYDEESINYVLKFNHYISGKHVC
jgi:RNA recognition motif-containing protein